MIFIITSIILLISFACFLWCCFVFLIGALLSAYVSGLVKALRAVEGAAEKIKRVDEAMKTEMVLTEICFR